MDDLDRILVSEESITPSGGFPAAVMEAVRGCYRHVNLIPFPWARFAIGLMGGLSCTLLTVILLIPRSSYPRSLGLEGWLTSLAWLCPPEVACAVLVGIGSLLTVRFSVGLTSD
jgi:hypothetical protein